ncbi:hypothetical protein PZS07_22220 [Providencia thailandensis]|uniref:Uncharacterized protein n=3 Tax=Providencia TaxID=586 RepID=A0AAJ1JRS4_PROST|nr:MULTISPECIES: hypothetical protein [Providencia]MDE5305491.1 hypothetical protein [Providencia stuartii]EUD12020.1 hypothetical protein HMPREF1563_1564 [Providencia alcalifaciens 205/92]MDE5307262.1 hypothetical protein [Providencia stuartii]MDE5308994.1 hypothetical protein [Providencia stuartii]MDE8752838.1 hypothetical protein [Providencia thailandensis]
MTTTVYDCDNKLAACDTRWSANLNIGGDDYIIHVDDTGFNKIVSRKGGIIICAGDGKTIEKIKKWWSEDILVADDMPDLEEAGKFSVGLLMIASNGVIVHDSGLKQVLYDYEKDHKHAIFLGSGAKSAANFFIKCGCAKSSVKGAESLDPWSGGEVKFIDLNTLENNLDDENLNYNSILTSMADRGEIMKANDIYIANSSSVETMKLSDHPQADEIKSILANGSVKAYSPVGGDRAEWTKEENEQIKIAAAKIASMEMLMNN